MIACVAAWPRGAAKPCGARLGLCKLSAATRTTTHLLSAPVLAPLDRVVVGGTWHTSTSEEVKGVGPSKFRSHQPQAAPLARAVGHRCLSTPQQQEEGQDQGVETEGEGCTSTCVAAWPRGTTKPCGARWCHSAVLHLARAAAAHSQLLSHSCATRAHTLQPQAAQLCSHRLPMHGCRPDGRVSFEAGRRRSLLGQNIQLFRHFRLRQKSHQSVH